MERLLRHTFPQVGRIVLLVAILQSLLAGVVLFVGHIDWAVTAIGLVIAP